MQSASKEASGGVGTPPSPEDEVTPRLLEIFNYAASWMHVEVQHTFVEANIPSAAHEAKKYVAPCCRSWHSPVCRTQQERCQVLLNLPYLGVWGHIFSSTRGALRISALRLR